jgi:hypothetical protein
MTKIGVIQAHKNLLRTLEEGRLRSRDAVAFLEEMRRRRMAPGNGKNGNQGRAAAK